MTDARWQRAHARLTEAVLDLASEQPVSALTVSAIAARAEVNRSTFYEHAPSASDLLQSVLRAELDGLRDQYLTDVAPEAAVAAVTDVTRAVLDHCDRHAAVYLANLVDLRAMLSDHFQTSTLLLVEHGVLAIPLGAEATTSVARYVADGTVGVIAVWLAGPSPRSTDAALHLLSALAPPWWPIEA